MHLKMKKTMILAAAALILASCSSDELINSPKTAGDTPIAFSVDKKNITRATNLEALGHYNFGVWAYKKTPGTKIVMNNYLVGYSNGTDKGYEKSGASTWAGSTDSDQDHISPWFYENLGKEEYSYDGALFYKKSQTAYMSANEHQYLRYWDLSFATTEFYAYAPYRAEGVTFNENARTITVAHAAQTAGYDDASLQEFIYAGADADNADHKDVNLVFKHLGAQLNLRFYEDVPGYRIEIIDVDGTGTGIQATPATMTDNGTSKTYTKSEYYTDCGATIDYASNPNTPVATVNFTGANTTDANLVFAIPGNGVIPEVVATGTQTYANSPTVYYPVAQPTTSETGFTFHVSYKLIAEDNGEVVVVNDARVYVPAKDGTTYIAAWQPNTKYTYTFKITRNSTGNTDPAYPDVNNPTVPATPTVYPIVFDGATVEDYTANGQNY